MLIPTHYVGFKAPATVGSNLVWTLPATDGSANQFLQTNASGVLSWGTADTSASMPLAGGTFTGNVTYNDGVEARFGAGTDLKIYHSSSDNNSYIHEAGSGHLVIKADDLYLQNAAATQTNIFAGNAVELKFGGNTKIATTNTGVAITGAATVSTDLTVTGDLTVSGTTTTINTQTLDVEDKNVVIGKVSSPSDTTADGGGWTLKGASDKTFNWVNATNAWTSSEHIHVLDNKKLLVGTGSDLSIYHDGTDSIISNATNVLKTHSSHLFIRNAAGNEDIAKFVQDGAVELYHNNVKKLETTSGGINVTGAINVNGSALSTAPQITATASGALTAGDPVIVNTNGTVSKIANTDNLKNPVPSPNSASLQNSSSYQPKICFDSNQNICIATFIVNSNGAANIKVGTFSGTTLSWNYSNNLNTGSLQYMGGVSYDITRQRVVACAANSSVTKIELLTVASNASVTNHQQLQLGSSGERFYPDIIYDVTAQKHVVVVGTNPGLKSYVVEVNANNTMTVHGSGVTVDSGAFGFQPVTLAYDTSTSKIFCSYLNGSDILTVRVGSISGTTISWGSAINSSNNDPVTNGGNQSKNIAAGGGKVVIAYRHNNAGHKRCQVRCGTVSGTSITWGSIFEPDTSNEGNQFGVHYDSLSDKFIVTTRRQNEEQRSFVLNISGTTCSTNQEIPRLGESVASDTNQSGIDMVTDTNANALVYVFIKNNGAVISSAYHHITTTTNLTSENYIGIAAGSVSDAASATIDVSGATNSNQSSLTAGQKYYVQTNGSLGLTAASPAVFAGTAISATKLIVNDQQPVPAGWTVINSEYIQTGHTTDPIISESLSSAYKMYRVQFYFVFASSGLLGLRIKHGGSWQTSNYWYQTHRASGGSVEDGYANNNANRLYAGASRMGRIINGSITFGNVHSTDQHKTFSMVTGMASELINGWATNTFVDHSFGGHNSTAAVTGLRFHCSSLSEGWFVLEGLAI